MRSVVMATWLLQMASRIISIISPVLASQSILVHPLTCNYSLSKPRIDYRCISVKWSIPKSTRILLSQPPTVQPQFSLLYLLSYTTSACIGCAWRWCLLLQILETCLQVWLTWLVQQILPDSSLFCLLLRLFGFEEWVCTRSVMQYWAGTEHIVLFLLIQMETRSRRLDFIS